VSSQLQTADSGGVPAPTVCRRVRPLPCRLGSGLLIPLAALAFLLTGCGVQAPPQPPRVEIPQQIKNLHVYQTGRTLHLTFSMPELATDGELLNKPVTVDFYRVITAAGQPPALPGPGAAPWFSMAPKELSRYKHAGVVDYPDQLSPQAFQQDVGSTYTCAVVTFTRGFRGHERRSAPSNVVHAVLVDVTQPVKNLQVKATQSALLFTWDKPAQTLTGAPPAHVSGYRIFQSSTGKPGSFRVFAQSPSTHFDDSNFHFGRQYYFQVSAVTTVGVASAESEPSAPVGILPRDVFPPPVPTGLTAVNAAGAVDLLWNASSGRDLAGYNVYRSADGGPFQRINKQLVPTPIFHDTSVAPGHHYQYAVTAVDLTGNESGKSPPASLATPSSARP
jgi:Fibronectin type III domain